MMIPTRTCLTSRTLQVDCFERREKIQSIPPFSIRYPRASFVRGREGRFRIPLTDPGRAMELDALQREVDAYIGQFKEGYFPPLVNLARLTEEVGELARELNHRFGPKTKKADEPEGDVALELADILFVVVVLANQLGVDLDEAVQRTLTKYRVRDADRWERKGL